MHKIMKAGLSTVATAALALGLLAAPETAMAEVCALTSNTGQPNNYIYHGNDNGYNPVGNTGGSSSVPATTSNTVCGANSTATGTNATTNGSNTTAGQGGTALGSGASATGTGSVALGLGSSDGGVAGVVSIGMVGTERRMINLAAGTSGTDAVNLNQLNLVSATAATALTNSATALTAATTAQSSATTALSNSAAALTAATTAQTTATTAQTTATTALSTATTAQTTASAAQTTASTALSNTITLQSMVASQTSQINSLFNLTTANQTEARRGIAAAVAMADAPFPSAPGRTSYATNAAIYRGEPAFSLSLTHRLNTDTPFAVSFGASYAGGKDTAFRVGVAGEF